MVFPELVWSEATGLAQNHFYAKLIRLKFCDLLLGVQSQTRPGNLKQSCHEEIRRKSPVAREGSAASVEDTNILIALPPH